ncbi:cytochrome P450, partial [Striga asiatica]
MVSIKDIYMFNCTSFHSHCKNQALLIISNSRSTSQIIEGTYYQTLTDTSKILPSKTIGEKIRTSFSSNLQTVKILKYATFIRVRVFRRANYGTWVVSETYPVGPIRTESSSLDVTNKSAVRVQKKLTKSEKTAPTAMLRSMSSLSSDSDVIPTAPNSRDRNAKIGKVNRVLLWAFMRGYDENNAVPTTKIIIHGRIQDRGSISGQGLAGPNICTGQFGKPTVLGTVRKTFCIASMFSSEALVLTNLLNILSSSPSISSTTAFTSSSLFPAALTSATSHFSHSLRLSTLVRLSLKIESFLTEPPSPAAQSSSSVTGPPLVPPPPPPGSRLPPTAAWPCQASLAH